MLVGSNILDICQKGTYNRLIFLLGTPWLFGSLMGLYYPVAILEMFPARKGDTPVPIEYTRDAKGRREIVVAAFLGLFVGIYLICDPKIVLWLLMQN
jgi:hypothetical protein